MHQFLNNSPQMQNIPNSIENQPGRNISSQDINHIPIRINNNIYFNNRRMRNIPHRPSVNHQIYFNNNRKNEKYSSSIICESSIEFIK